jgi:hypothetical protein
MKQLSLFKAKNQKGTAPPPALEFSSHVLLADICRRWLMPDWRFTHLPLGEHREHRIGHNGRRYSPTGNRLKRMGVSRGWPDFMFAGPPARMIWVELKRRKTGRLSEDQEDITDHLRACGFDFLVTDDVREAVAFLKGHGVLRSNFEVQ